MTILLELKCVGAFRNPMFEGQLFFPLENIKVFLDKICHRLMLQVELNLYSQTQTPNLGQRFNVKCPNPPDDSYFREPLPLDRFPCGVIGF